MAASRPMDVRAPPVVVAVRAMATCAGYGHLWPRRWRLWRITAKFWGGSHSNEFVRSLFVPLCLHELTSVTCLISDLRHLTTPKTSIHGREYIIHHCNGKGNINELNEHVKTITENCA